MKILIAGDIVPTKNNLQLFEDGMAEELLGKRLFEYWNSADYRIVNLEVPLCENVSPINKSGSNLFCSKKCINGIKNMSVNLTCLANNHIMDEGIAGYEATMKLLGSNLIEYVGVGKDSNSLKKNYIISSDNLKIGIYNCCDTEFTVASRTSAGANPFDPISSFDDVKQLREKCNCVVVIYHGGKEFYRYPSPYLQKICRKFVESGANVVLCQHSHCIGCYEEYNGNTILYGQGNFIFNKKSDDYWKTGLIVELNVSDNEIKVRFVPIQQNNNTICISIEKEKDKIIKEFERRSKEILEEGFIDREYSVFASKSFNTYIGQLFGTSLISRILYKLFGKKLYKERDYLNIQNILQCDAHRELFTEAIKVERKK